MDGIVSVQFHFGIFAHFLLSDFPPKDEAHEFDGVPSVGVAVQGGVFRHLPIVSDGAVKACISMRDVAQQIASGLGKKPLDNPPTVSDLMDVKGQGGCLTLGETGSVSDAVGLMQQSKAGSLLITNPGSASRYGIFTERDYLTKVAVYGEQSPSEIRIAHVATPSVLVTSVSPESRVTDCLSVMLAGGFRHVPVVAKGEPVGMVSMRDILNFFLGAS